MILDNIDRIQETYEKMKTKLEMEPKNEKELLELKALILTNEDDLKALKWEVLYVRNFMDILENNSF